MVSKYIDLFKFGEIRKDNLMSSSDILSQKGKINDTKCEIFNIMNLNFKP